MTSVLMSTNKHSILKVNAMKRAIPSSVLLLAAFTGCKADDQNQDSAIFEDNDGDGSPSHLDCNDEDASIYPFAGDTIGDGIDNDCDGLDCEAGLTGSGAYFAACAPAQGTSWDAWNTYCKAAGHDGLASIRSQEENDDLHAMLLLARIPWAILGGSDADKEGEWKWFDGAEFSFSNWNNKHYGGGASENCVEMDAFSEFSDGTWNDASCSSTGSTSYPICQTR